MIYRFYFYLYRIFFYTNVLFVVGETVSGNVILPPMQEVNESGKDVVISFKIPMVLVMEDEQLSDEFTVSVAVMDVAVPS